MATTKKTTSAVDAFIEYLHQCNMRLTSERLSIVEVIAKHSGLFTVDELRVEMSREAFPVSLATIYNTMDLLLDAGMVKCLRLPDRHSALYRLDLGDAPHIYLICEQCGAVKESHAKAVSRFITKHEFSAFSPKSFTLSVYGLCRKCRKLNDKKQLYQSQDNKPNEYNKYE